MLKHRLNYAYMLYDAKKAPKIIVSGAFDENEKKHESIVMFNYLLDLGVPKEDILLDFNGNNTYSTLKRTKDFVGNHSVIFCTQEVYSYRAIYIAKHLKLNINIFCSDPMIYSHPLKTNAREYLAQIKAILNCTIFSPKVRNIHDFQFIGGDAP